MCTLSIVRDATRTLITMNRDEARRRAGELPLRLHDEGAVAWAAPIDGAAMGTWMGVNASGLAACLMNLYGESAAAAGSSIRTRGEIVPACLEAGSLDCAAAWVESALRPELYPPFRLVLADRTRTLLYTAPGDGTLRREEIADREAVLSSSSWMTNEVLAMREMAFAAWLAAGRPFDDAIPSFHLARPGDDPRSAAMMAREESCTRSVTQAEINGGCVIRHWPVTDRRIIPPGETFRVGA